VACNEAPDCCWNAEGAEFSVFLGSLWRQNKSMSVK
jgi:hypothetical protein